MSSALLPACPTSDEPVSLVVKNTFLCLGSQAPTYHRRSNSLPPYLRSFTKAPLETSFAGDDSTDACTDDGTSEEGTACSDGGPASPAPRSPVPSSACLAGGAPEKPPEAPADAGRDSPPPAPPRAALSSKAAAWTPGAPLAGRFLTEVVTVLAAVQTALESGRFPVRVDKWEENDGWTLALRVGPSCLPLVEQLMLQTKQAMLTATELSSCVFVMGYENAPFVPTATGFAAMLGMMESEALACWDAYGQGFCCRGATCHWKHPASMVPVTVVLLLDPQLETAPHAVMPAWTAPVEEQEEEEEEAGDAE